MVKGSVGLIIRWEEAIKAVARHFGQAVSLTYHYYRNPSLTMLGSRRSLQAIDLHSGGARPILSCLHDN